MLNPKVNLRLIFNQCILCQSPTTLPSGICSPCYQDLPWLGQHCQRCALPLITEGKQLLCADCLSQPPCFDRVTALFHYRFPVNSLISKVKDAKQPQFIGHLAQLFADCYTPDSKPECLIPVPMHRFNYMLRGFNQAELLALELSRLLNLPCRSDLLIKKIRTQSQRGLARAERLKNQKQVFQSKESHYQHVLLVDDVMTTGATLDAASDALRRSGVAEIDCAVIARTDF